MKRCISFILVMMVSLSMMIPVSAATSDEAIMPLYDYTNFIQANLEIDTTWGIASCSGAIDAKSYTPVKVVVNLQQYKNGKWETIKSWEKDGMWSVTCSGQYAVYKGYTYRTEVIGTVYDNNGNILETSILTYEVDYLV